MIDGQVNMRREAIVELTVAGPRGSEITLNVIIDTGFTEFLTLPASLIQELGLTAQGTDTLTLGDGTVISAPVFLGRARLLDAWIPIVVQQSEGDILAGMTLFDNTELTIEAVIGGRVTVTALDQ